ncbi:MAG: AAA family ATPase [Gammaproteobacteria bacterium]|nr:AAA family ATPase [Gammaproteobacteria bacterium]
MTEIDDLPEIPDTKVSVRDAFGIDIEATVPAFSMRTAHVPEIDPRYRFDPMATKAILAGFSGDRRVLVQGPHGSGKSSHIEQVAARLNWPCVRINLDSHISRIDLLGKDAIVLREGLQVTEFREGMLPWSYQRPVALVFDEYDAGRPDVMFVIQRVLENDGRLTILDQNRVLTPHPSFRLFATANTIGLGDITGQYHGTQQLNQAQLDRWNVTYRLGYMEPADEIAMVTAKAPWIEDSATIALMVQLAGLTRAGLRSGDVSTVMSPRTVLAWAENLREFNDLDFAFETSFLNRCDEGERGVFSEYYQRCFGREPSQG